MSTENTVSLVVNLRGNVERRAQRFSQSFGRMSAKSRRHLATMNRGVMGLERTMGRLGNRYLALGSGGALAVAAKGVADFDSQMVRLGTDANLTEEQVSKLKKSIKEIANDKDRRIDDNVLKDATAQFLSKTGDYSFVEKKENLKNLGFVMQGLGADAVDSGNLLAQFWEKGIRDPQQVTETLDRLFTQFSQGSVSVKDIARVSPKLFSAILAQGPKAVSQMGALIQVYSKTKGSAEESTTSLISTLSTFNDPKKLETINKALVESGKQKVHLDDGNLRDVHTLFLDLAEVAGYSEQRLATVLPIEAINGFKSQLNPENRALLKKLSDGAINKGMTLDASAKNAKNAAAAIQFLSNVASRKADENLSQPIIDLAEAINNLDDKKIDEIIEKTKTWAKVIGGVYLAFKGIQLASNLVNVGRSLKGNKKSAVNSVLGSSATTPMFVWVINQGVGGGFDKTRKGKGHINTGNSSKGAKGACSKIANGARTLGKAAPALLSRAGYVGMAGGVGWGIGTFINKNFIEGTAASDCIGKSIAHVLMAFGSDEARRALIANGDLQERPTPTVYSRSNPVPSAPTEPAKVLIEIKDPASLIRADVERNNRAPETVVEQLRGGTMRLY